MVSSQLRKKVGIIQSLKRWLAVNLNMVAIEPDYIKVDKRYN